MNTLASAACRHCAEPVPRQRLLLAEPARGYCCAGCEAAAAFATGEAIPYSDYDSEDVLHTVALRNSEGAHEADILADNVRCGACAAGIETVLRKLSGLTHVSVNAHNRIVTVRWLQSQLPFSRILKTIADAGYPPHPLPLDAGLGEMRRDDRRAILRLGLAGLGAMQVMMLSLGLYMGSDLGLTGDIRRLLMWAAMLLATPVILYSGQPFFAGAWNDLRHRRAGMDVPVALAIGAAYGMSVFHTLVGQGEIWFDSAVMFVFFLSLGRHMEATGRRRAQQGLRALVAGQPQSVIVLEHDKPRAIPAEKLRTGMTLLIRPGQTLAADGVVLQGRSEIDESLLTGESTPQPRRPGDTVLAGSVNLAQALQVRVEKVGADTTRAHLLRLLRRAEARKPAVARMADRIAGYFVLMVLAIAAITGLIWAQLDPSRAFEITLAVLVVTCPCALSLATPASLTSGAAALARRGLLVTRGHTLEALSRITDVVFDKTGTLTDSHMEVAEVRPLQTWQRQQVLSLAARLERDHSHPIAEALRPYATDDSTLRTEWQAGRGVSATIDGRHYELGSPALLLDNLGPENPDDGRTWLVLTENRQPVGWIGLRARIRPEARQAVAALRAAGLRIHLMSGDGQAAVQQVADELGIEHVTARMLPDAKLAEVENLRRQGACVLMVGDGLNDTPVLAGADVSVAMQAGAALAQASADAVLLNENLEVLPAAHSLSLKVRRVLYQNLAWAVGYNALAVPLAVSGLLAPWMAAIGMSASSILVVTNALRLLRRNKSAPAGGRPDWNQGRELHA